MPAAQRGPIPDPDRRGLAEPARGEPWNPNGTSWTVRPTEDAWRSDLVWRKVWQARHGGYQVHHNSLVFAGTWTKTFTRMTTMEAACESARHAVNAILDHYVWVETGGTDRRERTTLDWRMPFDFIDQGLSVPVRLPSPAGDYCFVFDLENREPLETRSLRNLDSQYCQRELPHPLDVQAMTQSPPGGGPSMTNPPLDYTGQLLSYLQAWRQFLEEASASVPGPQGQASGWPTPSFPQMPGAVAVPPPVPPMPPYNPAGSTMTPGASPPPFPAAPGAAPPGPPVPPVAQVPGPATADAAGAPAQSRPPWAADAGRPASAPGSPAAFSAGSDAAVAPAQVPQPRSAYAWTERPGPVEAPGPPATPATPSLFAEAAPETPQRPWWEAPDIVSTAADVRPPENLGNLAPSAVPPPPLRSIERIGPLIPDGSAVVRTLPSPALARFGRLNLPTTLSPKPMHFPLPGQVEIIGGDPNL